VAGGGGFAHCGGMKTKNPSATYQQSAPTLTKPDNS